MHKLILLYVRQYDSAAILIAYIPISDDWTILDMFKHAVRKFAHGAIEGFKTGIIEVFINAVGTCP